MWNRLGARVTVLEALDRILPGTDSELAGGAQKLFEKQGLKFRLGVRVAGTTVAKDKCVVQCGGSRPDQV